MVHFPDLIVNTVEIIKEKGDRSEGSVRERR